MKAIILKEKKFRERVPEKKGAAKSSTWGAHSNLRVRERGDKGTSSSLKEEGEEREETIGSGRGEDDPKFAMGGTTFSCKRRK